MKKNVLLLLFAVILIAVVVLLSANRNSTLTADAGGFAIEDTSSITRIFLVNKQGDQVLLEKNNDYSWSLNKTHNANKAKVELMLETIKDIRVMAPVPKAMHNTVVKRLAANSTKIEIYQVKPMINLFNTIRLFEREKNTKTYFVGGPTKENIGTTMLMEDAEIPYITYLPNFRGFLTPRYSAIEDDWRDHTVFNCPPEEIQSISLEFIDEPENSYRVINLDNLNYDLIETATGHKLADYDTLRLLNFITAFRNIKYEALLSNKREPEFIDSVTASKPLHILHVVTKANDTIKATTYRKKGFSHLFEGDGALLEPADLDRMYALVNDDKDFVLIQYFVFDKVLRPLPYFIKEQ